MFNELLRCTAVLTVVMGLFSARFAVVSLRRRTNAAIYLDLSDRLHELYRELPIRTRAACLGGSEVEDVPDDIATIAVLNFLNFLNATFTLYVNGYFSGPLWRALSAEAERAVSLPVFQARWGTLRVEFSSRPDFIRYIEDVRARSASRVPAATA